MRMRKARASFRTIGACESIPGFRECQRTSARAKEGLPMDVRTSLLVLAAAVTAGPAALEAQERTAAHDLMPAPTRLSWQAGQLVLDARSTLASAGAADPRLDKALGRLRDRIEAQTKVRLAARPGG